MLRYFSLDQSDGLTTISANGAKNKIICQNRLRDPDVLMKCHLLSVKCYIGHSVGFLVL